ncbi:MAG: hypothetical protein HC843_08645 [Sphingomonadales bacterium]|nr:hypothetical protein [Sphingomonadales bacterium]
MSNRFIKRFFDWQEIEGVRIWTYRNGIGDLIPAAVLHVDGSRNRRRPLENLFLYCGYYLPPFLELDAFEFEKLLIKARRQLKRPKPSGAAKRPSKDG